jgi:hypothetical protein
MGLALLPAVWIPPGTAPGGGWTALTLASTWVHVAALALVTLQLRIPPAGLPAVFLLLAWLVPRLLTAPGATGRVLSGLLDPAQRLDVDWVGGQTIAAFSADMMPAVALLLAAGLIPSPPPPRS